MVNRSRTTGRRLGADSDTNAAARQNTTASHNKPVPVPRRSALFGFGAPALAELELAELGLVAPVGEGDLVASGAVVLPAATGFSADLDTGFDPAADLVAGLDPVDDLASAFVAGFNTGAGAGAGVGVAAGPGDVLSADSFGAGASAELAPSGAPAASRPGLPGNWLANEESAFCCIPGIGFLAIFRPLAHICISIAFCDLV